MARREVSRAALPVVNERDIRRLVGERSFDRARDYFGSGMISGLRVQGRTLRGRSEGSAGNTYEVSVAFDATGVTETACTCPMEAYCKHVGALLLAWRGAGGEIPVVEALGASLAKRSRQELVAIIERMVTLHPELESIATLSTTRGRARSSTDWGEVVAQAMRGAGHDWGATRAAAGALQRIVAQAADASSRNRGDAVEACRAVIDAALEARRDGYESEGELLEPMIEAARVLGERLATMKATDGARAPVVETLLEVALGDILEGGLGYGDDARSALDERATSAEQKRIAKRIGEVIPEASSWGREVLGGWLLALEGDALDDAKYLARCGELRLHGPLITRLLERGRVEEALREIARFEEPELVTAADLLVQRHHGAAAEQLVGAQYQRTRSTRLRSWLRARRKARGDSVGELELALEEFRERPYLSAYREVRALASKVGRWEALRAELRAALAKDRDATIRVLLEEGEHDAALAALDALKTRSALRVGWGSVSYGDAIELEVAEAIRETHPARAREIYQRRAEALIEARNRAAYQQACELLKRAKPLAPDAADWRGYLAALRARYPTLKAFQEELVRARL